MMTYGMNRFPHFDFGSRAARLGRRGALLLCAVATLAVGPGYLGAQEPARELGREELTTFARVHLAMNEAREAFHAAIAAAHEEQALERAREAFNERIAAILEEHGLTRERYGQILLIVSTDADARLAFDEVLEELQA